MIYFGVWLIAVGLIFMVEGIDRKYYVVPNNSQVITTDKNHHISAAELQGTHIRDTDEVPVILLYKQNPDVKR